MKYEYLIFNLIIIGLSSFGVILYKGAVFPKIKPALKSILTVSSFFIVWDYFVADNWWWFNEKYITGAKLANLPVEEVLFFITVPWSCLVIWVNLKKIIKGTIKKDLTFALLTVGLFAGIWAGLGQKWYTMTVMLLFSATICFIRLKSVWFQKRSFILFTFIVFILTAVFNGYLTARPVVLYNAGLITNFRLGTVPVEDFIYGILLVWMVVYAYEKRLA
jgi:lycopene cyclase domain-containing protein